jgi:alpha-1,2-mannosyltransferase
MAALSAARTSALVGYYSAPMRLFAQLPAAAAVAPTGRLQTVCIGDEWHRFPSSFYLPGPQYRLGFVKTGFAGLLPVPFDADAGGTAFAPPALNDRNEETAAQYVADPAATCDFWVGFQAEQPPNGARWSLLADAPFLDAGRSPALWRAFRVPLLSARRNAFTTMRLLRRDAAGAPQNAGGAGPGSAA